MSVANYQKNRALFSKEWGSFLKRIGLFSQKRPSNGRGLSLQRALSLKREKGFSLCKEGILSL